MISDSTAAQGVHDVERLVERWMYREARLLDEERYREWLELMAPDIHYWIPGIEVRRRGDRAGRFGPERMAFFDDDLQSLQRRVARFESPSAWGEDPPTRHLHVVSNIEVSETERPGEVVARSVVTSVRAQGRLNASALHGRREDRLRRVGDRLLLSRRTVLLTCSVLDAKNLNTFL